MSKGRAYPKPFVKWAGGKDQLLAQLGRSLPMEFCSYFEPFVGGGAVFFHIHQKDFRGSAFLSDLNKELIVAYTTVRDSVEELVSELSSSIYKADRRTFDRIRDWDRAPDWSEVDPVRRTARMIYLNKTCYNGLYRVNQKGHFNVPYGRHKNPVILDSENLRQVGQSLRNVTLQCTDFAEAVERASINDLVYLDPPYNPLNGTSNFTEYVANGFGEDEQARLAGIFRELDSRGCFVLESNSNTAMVRRLYSSYSIKVVRAKRRISCNPQGRGQITELLIRNY